MLCRIYCIQWHECIFAVKNGLYDRKPSIKGITHFQAKSSATLLRRGIPGIFNLEKPGPFQRIQINQKIKDGRMKILEPTAIDLFADAADFYEFEATGFNVLRGIDNGSKTLETFELNYNGVKSICGNITQVHYESDINH